MSSSFITKQALADALKQCMQTKTLEKVSIADICAVCQLNRKSFYYHFNDKYALVVWIFNQEIGYLLREYIEQGSSYLVALKLCTYFEEHRDFYMHALSDGCPGALRDHLVGELEPLVSKTLSLDSKSEINIEGVSRMVSDFLISALSQWLKRMPPISAEQFLDELIAVALVLTKRVSTLLNPTPE